MMKNRKIIFAVIFSLFVLGALAIFVSRNRKGNKGLSLNTLEKIKNRGKVRVGFSNEAPYAYMDTKTGSLTGEAPEIARFILKRMGIEKIEGVLTEFGSLIPGLKAGRFDMIAAGMYITPKRCKEAAFSNPSYVIGEAFIVKKGNPLNLHSFKDVANNHNAKIGVVVGTVERGYSKDSGVPDERIVVFPDTPSALDGILAGRIDAFAGTDLTVSRLLKKSNNPDLEKADPFHDPVIDGKVAGGYGAFVFRRQDQAFLKEFNHHLKKFIGTEAHLGLVRPFGFTKDNLPGDITAEELCEN